MTKDNNSEDDNAFWSKKRRFIRCNIRKSIESREKVLDEINGGRGNFDRVSFQVHNELEKLRDLENFYESDNTRIDVNPVFEGSIDSLAYYSEMDAQRWGWLREQSHKIRTQTDSFVAAASASGSMVPSMVSGTYLIAERIEPLSHRYKYTEKIKTPTPLDRKTELVEKLRKVDSVLALRLEGAWQTLNDTSKADRVSQAGTSFRELITALLNRFAPREDVEFAWWFESDPDNDRRPTRKQRIRYAIVGNNKDISEKELDVIIELVNNLYKEFDKLNKVTHLQKYDTDLDSRTRGIFDQCQIHLLKVLELRESYFKK